MSTIEIPISKFDEIKASLNYNNVEEVIICSKSDITLYEKAKQQPYRFIIEGNREDIIKVADFLQEKITKTFENYETTALILKIKSGECSNDFSNVEQIILCSGSDVNKFGNDFTLKANFLRSRDEIQVLLDEILKDLDGKDVVFENLEETAIILFSHQKLIK